MQTEGMSGPVAKAIAASNVMPVCDMDEGIPVAVYNHEKITAHSSETPNSEKALVESMAQLSFSQEGGESDAECEVIEKTKEDEIDEYFVLCDKNEDVSYGGNSLTKKRTRATRSDSTKPAGERKTRQPKKK